MKNTTKLNDMIQAIEENEMEFIITGEDLKELVQMKFEEMKDALENEVDEITYKESVDENGETICSIFVYDKTISTTSIRCDKEGWNIHWGSSTPVYIQSEILEIMGYEE
ncbi:TPA: hypothetical protein ACQUHH_001158 [Bacillus mobilis]